MATCRINLRTHPTKKATALRSHKLLDMDEILFQDVSDAVLQVADCELREQNRLKNEPTNLFLNNRPIGHFPIRSQGSSKGQFIFRARMLFGQADQILMAAFTAMQLLRTLTRIKTGDAKASYWIFLGNTGNTKSPGALKGFGIDGLDGLRDQITANSMITIAGPTVAYGRKLYWNPAGGKKLTKRLATAPGIKALLKGTKTGGYKGSATIHRDVKKRMARNVKYKALSFADPFYVIPMTDIVGDQRVPAISITLKASGRIN